MKNKNIKVGDLCIITDRNLHHPEEKIIVVASLNYYNDFLGKILYNMPVIEYVNKWGDRKSISSVFIEKI